MTRLVTREYLDLLGKTTYHSYNMSRVARKICLRVSDQVRHKPGCTTAKDGYRLEILDLGSRGIVLFM